MTHGVVAPGRQAGMFLGVTEGLLVQGRGNADAPYRTCVQLYLGSDMADDGSTIELDGESCGY